MSFGLRKELKSTYEETLARLPGALKSEGFGVLTEIDMKETLKQKLGVEFRRYRILGACNPPIAHAALQADPGVGLMMPCNVVVYENDGKAVVETVDPVQSIGAHGGPALQAIAQQIREKLGRVLDQLS